MSADTSADGVIIVGAGAAGLATAIFARQANPRSRVRLLDSAARPGAKILVSGGSRCNVTNTVVTERDYWGGKRTVIRRVLSRFTVAQTIAFFEGLGVPLKTEEPHGKLFPVSDRSRDVLEALLGATRDLGVEILPSTRVNDVLPESTGFRAETSRGPLLCRAVVLATGGLSLPKTGSDGKGFEIARRLGHTIVATTPALVPLTLGESSGHAALSGVAQAVELVLRVGKPSAGAVSPGALPVAERIRGAMLWTHFGISGPAALDMSRHWLRARVDGQQPFVTVNFAPGRSFDELETYLSDATRVRPRTGIHTLLAEDLPAASATAILNAVRVDPSTRLADLSREDRRRVVHALSEFPLDITGTRGYNYAEATAGGIALEEIDPTTMHSRRCPGLYLVGEMLDVDGRLGGFNFQWAWSSARTAAEALSRLTL